MDSEMQITLSTDFYLMQIKALKAELDKVIEENNALRIQLEYEKNLRLSESRPPEQQGTEKKTRKRKIVTQDSTIYSDYKSDGKRKPHPADSIRSYDDFKAIQKFYLDKGRIRDWAMWTLGVCLGIRVSDLLSLRWKNVLETDKKTFKKRIQIYEIKTGKLQNCLITEAAQSTLLEYLSSLRWQISLDDYIFPSKKTGGKMYEEYGWKILSDAGKALELPITIGSHTMRKSFANIAACVDKSSIDMNSITKVQGLLNHSDQKVTMKYLGTYQEMFDRARIAVSDFILGKTQFNDIIAGEQFTANDIVERLEALEKMLQVNKETAKR